MYYTLPEITPAIKEPGDYRFNKANDRSNGKSVIDKKYTKERCQH